MKSDTTAKRILLTAAALFSISGFILRYFQLKGELLPDGSLAAGACLHRVLAIVTVCFAVGIAILLWKLPKLSSWKQCFQPRPAYEILHLLAAGFLLIGNVVLWIQGSSPASAYLSTSPGFSTFLNHALPPLGIVAAVCLGAFAVVSQTGKRPSPLLYMCMSLYLIIRLIVCFQAWNTDPSIYDYCYMLLAAISTMLAAFQLAGFSFDKGKRRITLFWTLTAALFCCISLADAFYDGELGSILVMLALLLTNSVSTVQLLSASSSAEESAVSDVETE